MKTALSEAGVDALGQRLGRTLPRGTVVWLEGPLGAGKTRLVRAVVSARSAGPAATSPTFNLVHRYPGWSGPVFHVDCYRMRHPSEAAELDWDEMLAADLLLIEWPDRGGAWVPRPGLRVTMDHAPDPDQRIVELVPPLAEMA